MTLRTVAPPASPSRQEFWSEPPCPPPGLLPTQGRNPRLSGLLLWKACPFPPTSPRDTHAPNEAAGKKEAQGLRGGSRDPGQGVHPLTEQPARSAQFLSPGKAPVPGLRIWPECLCIPRHPAQHPGSQALHQGVRRPGAQPSTPTHRPSPTETPLCTPGPGTLLLTWLLGRPVPTLPTPSPGGGSDHMTSRAPLRSVKPPSFPAPTLPCKRPYVLKTHFPCQVLGWVFTRACSVGVSLRGRESTIRPLGSSRKLWWEMPGATAPRGLESVSRTAPSTGLQRPPAPLGLSTQGPGIFSRLQHWAAPRDVS